MAPSRRHLDLKRHQKPSHKNPKPTALFALKNFNAYIALKALRQAGLNVAERYPFDCPSSRSPLERQQEHFNEYQYI
jgi:hypothetical protein